MENTQTTKKENLESWEDKEDIKRFEYNMVFVERKEDKPYTYLISGLPKGKSFKKKKNFETHKIDSWIKLNGFGISCNSLEISEHNNKVVVETNEKESIANIYLNKTEN